jgi:hypothetical protein
MFGAADRIFEPFFSKKIFRVGLSFRDFCGVGFIAHYVLGVPSLAHFFPKKFHV